jgi:hypothetical protein
MICVGGAADQRSSCATASHPLARVTLVHNLAQESRVFSKLAFNCIIWGSRIIQKQGSGTAGICILVLLRELGVRPPRSLISFGGESLNLSFPFSF